MKKWIIGTCLLVLVSTSMFLAKGREEYYSDQYNTLHVLKEQVLEADNGLVQTIDAIEEVIEEFGSEGRVHDRSGLEIYQYDNETSINVECENIARTEKAIQVLEEEMGLEGLGEDLEKAYKEIEEENKNKEWNEVKLLQYPDEQVIVYAEVSSSGKSFSVKLPHQVVKLEEYKALHDAIGSEGYIIDDIITGGENDLLIYKDMPLRIGHRDVAEGEVFDHSGLRIEVEVSDGEIVRVSGIVRDILETGEAIALAYYQQEMLMGILDYWNVSTDDQEQIWDRVISDITNKEMSNKETTSTYSYKSKTFIEQYSLDKDEFLMKFDITK